MSALTIIFIVIGIVAISIISFVFGFTMATEYHVRKGDYLNWVTKNCVVEWLDSHIG